jgi:hypothetical protein
VISRFGSLLAALIVAAATPADAQNRALITAQTRLPAPSTPLTVHVAPTPAPLAPPNSPGPAIAPPGGLSPLLSQPGSIFSTLPRAGPSYPAATYPTPLGQQQTQSYRSDLLSQRWQLEQQGVSPDNERYRELQQQLNQPSSR